jgi:hypothetical protein
MKKFLLLLLFAAPLYVMAQPASYNLIRIPEPQVPTLEKEIPTMLFLPPGYTATGGERHPLIIFLHGAGETGYGSQAEIDNLNSLALPLYLKQPGTTMTYVTPTGTHSFVVLVPQKHKDSYTVPDPCDATKTTTLEHQFPAYYIDAMINYATANLNIDPTRIYLTGLSLGAGIVWDYPSISDVNARKIAGIVPASGNPVHAYDEQGGVAGICNIAENRVASRGYIGDVDRDFGCGRLLVDRIDSAERARDYVNNTCVAPGKKTSELLFSPGGHSKQFWDTIYHPLYGINKGEPNLNMYTWMLQQQQLSEITPVTMIYFKGKSLNDQNILQWATSRELNSDRFELLRSTDGENFTVIATFKTSDNSSGDKEYQYKDNSAPKGTSYYQLRQVDINGKSTLSRIVTIQNKNQVFVVEKYPNPVTDRLNITIEGSIFGPIELQVLDMKGNLVKKVTIRKEQANWKGFIDVNQLSKGVYMFHLKGSDGKKEVSSFIKN